VFTTNFSLFLSKVLQIVDKTDVNSVKFCNISYVLTKKAFPQTPPQIKKLYLG